MNVEGAQGGASWACTYNRIENPENAELDIVCRDKPECAASVQGAAGACRERAGNTEWNERAGAIECSYSLRGMLEWMENGGTRKCMRVSVVCGSGPRELPSRAQMTWQGHYFRSHSILPWLLLSWAG